MTRNALLLIGLIGAIGAIYLATLREGQEWGDDFGLYVTHARNIAEGRPYADTGYIYNPADPVLSPRTYPPIFPLLLVPVYLVFGMNLTAMKVFVVPLFLVLLGVLALLLRKRLPFPFVLGCLALFALNPYVWQQKDRLLSETPFMLFAYLALVLAEKAQEQTARRRALLSVGAGSPPVGAGSPPVGAGSPDPAPGSDRRSPSSSNGRPSVRLGARSGDRAPTGEKAQEQTARRRALIWGLLAGMAAYLAFGTRTVGVVLIPSFLVCDWLRRRRLGMASGAMVAVFLIGVAAQKCLLVVEGSYLDQLVFDPALYARIALSLVRALGSFLENGYSSAARLILFACLLAPASWAYLARLRVGVSAKPQAAQGLTVCELFAFFNGLVLVFWPAAEYGQRFLLPILPLFFLWVAEGLHRVAATSFRRLEKPLAAVLTLAVLLSYAGWYSRMDAGTIRDGVSSPEAVALFDWVRKETDSRDVFLFPKPRAFALYTRRHALADQKADAPPRLTRTLRKHGVTHIVVHSPSSVGAFQKNSRLVQTVLAARPSVFEKVYENRAFRVYRLRARGLARTAPPRFADCR